MTGTDAGLGPVVIHIGWHKSASTFLQQGVFRHVGANFQSLDGAPPDGTPLAGGATMVDLVEAREGFDAAAFRRMVLSLRASKDQLTIISQEELSGHAHGYALIDAFATARNLASAFPGARILAVTRNQFEYILSLYAYRVGIRGHESRSLERFVREDMQAGLQAHLEYDRLLGEYARLFGAENVQVLPMEMLRSDPDRFFSALAAFIGCAPTTPPLAKPANESTRLALVLSLWRPLNALFHGALLLRILLNGRRPADVAPQKQKIFPYMHMRYRYYAFKRRTTARLNRLFSGGRRLRREDLPDFRRLERAFSDSNRRLQGSGMLDWDMGEFGYPNSSPDG